VSAPPKPNRWLKKKALTPSAAANDSTTVAVRISGATSARSSSMRMMNTTARMSEMMTLRSCADVRSTSRALAVAAPRRQPGIGLPPPGRREGPTVSIILPDALMNSDSASHVARRQGDGTWHIS
jgi:hypothetical protein